MRKEIRDLFPSSNSNPRVDGDIAEESYPVLRERARRLLQSGEMTEEEWDELTAMIPEAQ